MQMLVIAAPVNVSIPQGTQRPIAVDFAVECDHGATVVRHHRLMSSGEKLDN
jgi:hypothetical protein